MWHSPDGQRPASAHAIAVRSLSSPVWQQLPVRTAAALILVKARRRGMRQRLVNTVAHRCRLRLCVGCSQMEAGLRKISINVSSTRHAGTPAIEYQMVCPPRRACQPVTSQQRLALRGGGITQAEKGGEIADRATGGIAVASPSKFTLRSIL
jgi:hypothetical protein